MPSGAIGSKVLFLNPKLAMVSSMKHFLSAFALPTILLAAPSFAQSASKDIDLVVEAAEAETESAYEGPREPWLTNYTFIKQVDYPIEAWQADEAGQIGYSVEVSAEGKPLSCEITDGIDLAILAAATCPLVMERAKFRPATDENGENVAATYLGSYRWRKREVEMPEMSIIFQYLHDAKGVSRECKFLKLENVPQEMRDDIERDKARGKLCPGPAGKQGVPYRDENGVPIAKLVTVNFDVSLEDPKNSSPE